MLYSESYEKNIQKQFNEIVLCGRWQGHRMKLWLSKKKMIGNYEQKT